MDANVKAVALNAITEAVNILYNLAAVTYNKQWTIDSVYIGNLDKMAQALGFPNALAVQERIEGDKQHEADKYRDMDGCW